MAESWKIELGLQLQPNAISDIQNQINAIGNRQIKINLNTQNAQTQIDNLKKQLQNLGNIKINLNANSSNGIGGINKTVNEVNNAYRDLINLQRRISSIRIQIGGLDSTKNSGQITELSGQLNRLMADYNNLYQTFSKDFSTDQLDNLNRSFETTSEKVANLNAKMQDTSAVKQQETAYKQLYSIAKQMGDLELKIGGLKTVGGNNSQITVLTAQLENLRIEYQSLLTSMQGQLTDTQLSTLGESVYDVQNKLDVLNAKIADTKAKLVEDIKIKTNNGDLGNQIGVLESNFKSLNTTEQNVTDSIKKLKSLLETMDSSDDIESVITDYEKFQETLTQTTNRVKQLQREQKQNVDDVKLDNARTALSSKMEAWLVNNSAAAKQFGSQVQQLRFELEGADKVKLNNIETQFQELTRQAQIAGVATQSVGDRFKTKLGEFSTYFSAAMLMSRAVRGIRSMYQNTLSVDTAMTELYRVTDLTTNQYTNLYNQMINSAKEYGSELDSIINSTASWVRLGFNPDEAEGLAEVTSMYQHVTDLDEKTAVENLVTAYKGFEQQLLETTGGDKIVAIEQIADIYDKLGNEFAESAADVGDGLSKSAAVLQQGGASIQEAAGMFTGIQEVLQNSSTAGTALKVLTLRIRGMKGELQELGEDVDDKVDSISKIQTQILNVTHGKVNIFDDEGNFRNIYNIMGDISKIYDSLSDTDRASLLETIAGKTRANAVQALISNWQQVEKATQSAYESEGTAAAENEKYMASMQGHLNALTSAWQALSANTMKSGTLNTGIDALTTLVNILDTLINKFGLLPTLITAVGSAMAFKNIGRDKMFSLKINMPIIICVPLDIMVFI